MKKFLPKSKTELVGETAEIVEVLSEIADRLESLSEMAIMEQVTSDGKTVSEKFRSAAGSLRNLKILFKITDALKPPNRK
ncbi:hypothetical protein ES702_06289 [subsurface metagenome]